MANSSSVQPWALTMPLGSLQQWLFTFTTVNQQNGQSAPYPITGATWEYVARATADGSGTAVIDVTTTPNSQGALTVTANGSVSTVQLNLYPAATSGLAVQTYQHALWQNPGSGSAVTWFSGPLIISGAAQP